MRNIYRVIFIMFVFWSSFSVYGQRNGTIIGTVHMEDGAPIAGVTVREMNTLSSTVTDREGKFRLAGLFQGKHEVMVFLDGFEEIRKTIIVQSGTVVVLDFSLTLKVITEEATVTAERPLLNVSEKVSQVMLTPNQIESLPSLGEKDIFRAFQLLPGISGSNEASSGLYVRGGTPDQNLVLFDRFTVYHVEHLFGYFSAFNMEAVEEVNLMKGGFGAQYGGRISSIMELTGKSGGREKIGFGAGFSLLSFNGLIEIPLTSKASLILTGRRSFSSPLYNKIADMVQGGSSGRQAVARPGGGGGGGRMAMFESQPISYFYDLNGKFSFDLTDKQNFSVSFYNGKDDLDNSREMSSPSFLQERGINLQSNITDLTEWGNTGISLSWDAQWNKFFLTRITGGYSNFFNNRERNSTVEVTITEDAEVPDFFLRRPIRLQGTGEKNDIKDTFFRWDNEFRLAEKHRIGLGFQLTSHDIIYNFDTQESLIEDEDGEEIPPNPFFNVLNRSSQGEVISFYLEDRWTLFNRLTLTPGIRSTYFNVTEEAYYEPRFSFHLKLTDRFAFKGAWGRYYQFVNRITREDVLQGNREFWSLADSDQVPVGTAHHYILGLSYETDMLLFDVETFYKDLEGLAEFAPRFSLIPEERDFNRFFYQGTGIAKGLEILVQKKYGRLSGWLSYTLSRVLYDFPDLSETPYPALHDQAHEFKLVGMYDINQWRFSATWIYASGKPYTPPVGVEQVERFNGRLMDQVIIGDKNSGRLPAYHRMDLSANYRFKFGGGNSTIGLTLFNLYNRKNVWYKEFQVVEGEIIENNINLMSFTVNLFLNIKF